MVLVVVNDGLLFFFNDTATTEIYTLSLHDALPILASSPRASACCCSNAGGSADSSRRDRKRTRLNSSHGSISYAVFCLKKQIIGFLLEHFGGEIPVWLCPVQALVITVSD